jgi:hypothetical protein
MKRYRRNISIHKIIILEHSRGWDYIPVGTWAWYERCGVFPAKTMKRKEKKKFRMCYRDLPF